MQGYSLKVQTRRDRSFFVLSVSAHTKAVTADLALKQEGMGGGSDELAMILIVVTELVSHSRYLVLLLLH